MTDEMMHDHNLDLIMALAEGSLDDAERVTAEAEIAACDECVVELAAQQFALEALSAAEPPMLTELESARMRRSLKTELGIADPKPVVPSRPAEARRWQGWSVGLSAAAVFLLLVAVVPALNLFGADDGSSSDTTNIAFAATTAAPATTVSRASAQDSGIAESAPTEALATTSAPTGGAPAGAATTTTQLPQEERAGVAFGDITVTDLANIDEAARFAYSVTGDPRNLEGVDGDLEGFEFDDRIEVCKQAGLEFVAAGALAVELGSAVLFASDVYIIAYVDTETDDLIIAAHDVDGCEILETTG